MQTNENDVVILKDSGQRTEFESGAVRDLQAGKGRCDLLYFSLAQITRAIMKRRGKPMGCCEHRESALNQAH